MQIKTAASAADPFNIEVISTAAFYRTTPSFRRPRLFFLLFRSIFTFLFCERNKNPRERVIIAEIKQNINIELPLKVVDIGFHDCYP